MNGANGSNGANGANGAIGVDGLHVRDEVSLTASGELFANGNRTQQLKMEPRTTNAGADRKFALVAHTWLRNSGANIRPLSLGIRFPE